MQLPFHPFNPRNPNNLRHGCLPVLSAPSRRVGAMAVQQLPFHPLDPRHPMRGCW
jgi:hypothetical protein